VEGLWKGFTGWVLHCIHHGSAKKISGAPTRGEIRRLIVKNRLSARTVDERMSRLSNPATNFRVRGPSPQVGSA
jgi:hypothetical protein